MIHRTHWLAIASLSSFSGYARAEATTPASDVFTLGQITVTAPRERPAAVDATVTSNEIWTFNANTLDEAVKLIPGVTATLDSNGRRNEHDILVRGYGRWQVPLSVDGIRIYLPADNRLDFARFLTQDLAEIQVQKGYASVLDGPGGLGGAINLVTRKPTRAFESEFQSGASFGGDGDYDAWSGSASLGTRQDRFYLQASGSYLDRDQWQLSSHFRPTAIEDGGARNASDNRDWRINAKAGYTPNATDEYSLSYTSQSGSKGAPLNVFNNPPNPPNSYWRWPWWDIENVYWLSNTQINDRAYVKTRLFYNTFDNALYAYDNATYTTQSANGRFRSIYADEGHGGSIELGSELLEHNTVRAAVHYRRDEHGERNFNRPTHPTLSSVEPVQTTKEATWSIAVEDTFAATNTLDLILGLSYDRNELTLAQDFNNIAGLFSYPTGGSSAINAQGLVRWRYMQGYELRASISSRTRFPTIFERFSTRFGTALPNPDLDPERGKNYELGWSADVSAAMHLSAAVFYNDVTDMVQTVIVSAGPPQLTQTQNVGDGEYYGLEIGADTSLSSQLRIGGNYSYLERKIRDPVQPAFRPTGAPRHQGLVFLSYQPVAALTIMPSMEVADDRWSDVTGGTYAKVGEYVLANLQVEYRSATGWDVVIGGRNLLDDDYQLAHGFPEPGRTWFAKLKIAYR